eukprot:5394981-Pleurochrysis_carterae.AAC.6
MASLAEHAHRGLAWECARESLCHAFQQIPPAIVSPLYWPVGRTNRAHTRPTGRSSHGQLRSLMQDQPGQGCFARLRKTRASRDPAPSFGPLTIGGLPQRVLFDACVLQSAISACVTARRADDSSAPPYFDVVVASARDEPHVLQRRGLRGKGGGSGEGGRPRDGVAPRLVRLELVLRPRVIGAVREHADHAVGRGARQAQPKLGRAPRDRVDCAHERPRRAAAVQTKTVKKNRA